MLIGGQSSLSKVNILGTVCVFVWSSIIVLLCAFQGPRLAHGYHIKCLCEGCFRFLGCHWLIHWHSSLLSLFGSWIFIPKSCLYIDRCVLSGHSIHFQPHKQAACVVKKVFSLPSPPLLYYFFPHPLSWNSTGFSCVERANSVIKVHLAIFVWSSSGYICVKPSWIYFVWSPSGYILCGAHLAIFVWSPSGYICMKPIWLYLYEAYLVIFVWSPSGDICVKPIWLYLCEAHLAIFVWSPSGYLWEAHLAICEKPIWLFVWSSSGYLWEAHLAICVNPIWLYLCEAHLAIFVWSPSGNICVKPIWLYLCKAHLAIFTPGEAHLAIFVWSLSGYICVKPIWLFVRSPSGYLCEAHLAICVKLIWLFV